MRIFRTLLLGLCLAPLAACSGPGPTQSFISQPRFGELVETLYVAPQTSPCSGEGIHTCLLVRRDPAAPWGLFYDGIQDFTHQPGYAYTLSVASSEVVNPPADASSRHYRLLRILSREAQR
jgi:hypothetical protein